MPTSPRLPERGVAAHRGGPVHAPENTLAAFLHAARLGVHQIELDVRRCATGEIVVMHDETVDRTTDGEGAVAALPFEELRTLKVAGREPVPTLQEVLAALPHHVWINVQIKRGEPIAAEVARQVAASGRLHQVLVACHNEPGRIARSVRPDIRLCNLSRKETRLEYIRNAAKVGAEFIQLHHRRGAPTAKEVASARSAGLRINYFAGDEAREHPQRVAELFEAGVDFVLVDDLETALAQARAAGIPPANAAPAS